jgi:hypothetical protein
MKAFFILLLVVATAACGAYRFPGGGTGSSGSVSGQVTVVPCAPVEPAAQPCTGRPASGLEIDFSGDGSTVASQTGPKGYYSVELPAGSWKVSFKGYMRIVSGPPTVTVSAGSSVVANYVVDSGIRLSG